MMVTVTLGLWVCRCDISEILGGSDTVIDRLQPFLMQEYTEVMQLY